MKILYFWGDLVVGFIEFFCSLGVWNWAVELIDEADTSEEAEVTLMYTVSSADGEGVHEGLTPQSAVRVTSARRREPVRVLNNLTQPPVRQGHITRDISFRLSRKAPKMLLWCCFCEK